MQVMALCRVTSSHNCVGDDVTLSDILWLSHVGSKELSFLRSHLFKMRNLIILQETHERPICIIFSMWPIRINSTRVAVIIMDCYFGGKLPTFQKLAAAPRPGEKQIRDTWGNGSVAPPPPPPPASLPALRYNNENISYETKTNEMYRAGIALSRFVGLPNCRQCSVLVSRR